MVTSPGAMDAKERSQEVLMVNHFLPLITLSFVTRNTLYSRTLILERFSKANNPEMSTTIHGRRVAPHFADFQPSNHIKCERAVKSPLCLSHTQLLLSEFGLNID